MKVESIFFVIYFLLVSLLIIVPVYAQGDLRVSDRQGHMQKTDMRVNDMALTQESTGICSVMGGKINKEYSYNYQGKAYYFCCPMCIEKFKKDPEKYISKIKEIKLEAYQFGFSPEIITVKKGDIVTILVTSRDVTHGVYIQGYNINVTVDKEAEKKIEFIADKIGQFEILCSVYCGEGHRQMKAKLIVEG
jgi:cytochrome c oxidase subunit 2